MSKVLVNQPDVKKWQPPEVGEHQSVNTHSRTPAEEAGYLRGYQEGLTAAHDQAYSDAKQAASLEFDQVWQDKITKLSHLLRHLQKPMLLIDHEVEHALVGLVKQLVMRLTRTHMQVHSHIIKKIVRDVLALLPKNSQQVIIYSHADDIPCLQELLCDVNDFHCEIEEDTSLQVGDIRVQTQETVVDASIAIRLHNLMEQMTDYENAIESTSTSASLSDPT